jgi:hypothetical protein
MTQTSLDKGKDIIMSGDKWIVTMKYGLDAISDSLLPNFDILRQVIHWEQVIKDS